MNKILSLILECANAGIHVRQVPAGYRISIPLAAHDDTLIEIGIQELDHDFVRLTDAGFLRERLAMEGLMGAPTTRLHDFMFDRGYESWDDRGGLEFGWEGPLADAGCAALDLGADIYAALRIAENSLRERQESFVRIIDQHVRNAFGKELEYRYAWKNIVFPFAHKASGLKGTYVGTNAVNPSILSVANNQFMPLMRAKAVFGKSSIGRHVAIVQNAFADHGHVRSLAKDAGAKIIPEESFKEGLRIAIDAGVGKL